MTEPWWPWGGWKGPAMLSRYAHLSPTHLWSAVEGLTTFKEQFSDRTVAIIVPDGISSLAPSGVTHRPRSRRRDTSSWGALSISRLLARLPRTLERSNRFRRNVVRRSFRSTRLRFRRGQYHCADLDTRRLRSASILVIRSFPWPWACYSFE